MAILEKTVTQANPLIVARKKMSVTEMRLFLLGLQDITPHIKEDIDYDLELHETIIAPSELKSLFGGNDGSVVNLKKRIKEAYRGIIEIPYINGGFELNHIYHTMEYEPEVGLIIKFDNRMKPYILDILDQYYTTYKIKDVFPLSSEYGWRIMELLQGKKGFFKQGHKEIYVELCMKELRFCLNVQEGLYEKRIDNFKKHVLDIPIKEINAKTNYKVWYETKKTGRRVSGFVLWMAKKTSEEKEKNDEERQEQELRNALKNSETVRALAEAGVNLATAKILVEKHGEPRCLANLKYARQTKTSRIENFPGYVVKCIEDDLRMGQNLFDELDADEREAKKAREKKEAEERAQADFDKNYGNYEITSPFWKKKKEKFTNKNKM